MYTDILISSDETITSNPQSNKDFTSLTDTAQLSTLSTSWTVHRSNGYSLTVGETDLETLLDTWYDAGGVTKQIATQLQNVS